MKRLMLIALMLPVVAFCGGKAMTASIQEVKARHASRLLELPGVVSVGIGRNASGEPIIVVGLDQPRPETEARIPADLEGYPVSLQVIGKITPRSEPSP